RRISPRRHCGDESRMPVRVRALVNGGPQSRPPEIFPPAPPIHAAEFSGQVRRVQTGQVRRSARRTSKTECELAKYAKRAKRAKPDRVRGSEATLTPADAIDKSEAADAA